MKKLMYSAVIVFMFNSCSVDKLGVNTNFKWINKTDKTLVLKDPSSVLVNYKIKPFEVFERDFRNFESCDFTAPPFQNAVIEIDGMECVFINTPDDMIGRGKGITGFQNYKVIQNANGICDFEYTITEKDLEGATECD